MNVYLLAPPVAFAIVLAAFLGLAFIFKRLALRKAQTTEQSKPYACGEDGVETQIQPDYSQFFPFAFYFTILHVIALVAGTIPVVAGTAAAGTVVFAMIYLACAAVGLLALYRR